MVASPWRGGWRRLHDAVPTGDGEFVVQTGSWYCTPGLNGGGCRLCQAAADYSGDGSDRSRAEKQGAEGRKTGGRRVEWRRDTSAVE